MPENKRYEEHFLKNDKSLIIRLTFGPTYFTINDRNGNEIVLDQEAVYNIFGLILLNRAKIAE